MNVPFSSPVSMTLHHLLTYAAGLPMMFMGSEFAQVSNKMLSGMMFAVYEQCGDLMLFGPQGWLVGYHRGAQDAMGL